MSQANFDTMSDAELRRYFLSNRQDQAAFQAYLDRFSQRPKPLIASPSDPDFDAKIQAAIQQKLETSRRNQQADNTVEQFDGRQFTSTFLQEKRLGNSSNFLTTSNQLRGDWHLLP